MKKTFQLHVPGKKDSRVLESIKLEITKYVKRERRNSYLLKSFSGYGKPTAVWHLN
jgi:hypothetical protein